MIRDPLEEVLGASLRAADDATVDTVDGGDLRDVRLARRRFGVALPPPFVAVPAAPAALPIRPADPADGAAIAAVQRRAWRHSYRGLLSDRFLDELDFSYLGAYWAGRATVSPTPRHRLLVAGGRGEVHGVVDVGPSRDDDVDHGPDGLPAVGEVRSLYLDPSVQAGGLGSALLATAVEVLDAQGSPEAVLWVVEGNAPARRFYERRGWAADGGRKVTPVEDEELTEVRYRRRLGRAAPGIGGGST
jgi:GNAT superfamily N-acetyltransferase